MFRRTQKLIKHSGDSKYDREAVLTIWWFLFIPLYRQETVIFN